MQYPLFKGFELPDDERALDILERISILWEDNGTVYPKKSGIHHQRVTYEQREKLIEISVTEPQLIEEKLADEITLPGLLLWLDSVDF